jgi:hypothetical protein
MRPTPAGGSPRRHLAIAALILAAGLVSSVAIYLHPGAEPDSLLDFSPETSKKYLRALELYGGTANVLAVRFQAWFAGLWHGRSLAYTVAVLALAAALVYVFFTVVLPPYHDPAAPEGRPRESGR